MLVLGGLFVWQEGDRENRRVWNVNPLATTPEVEVWEIVEIDPPYKHNNLLFSFGVVLEEVAFGPSGRAALLKVGFKSKTYAELWAKQRRSEVSHVTDIPFSVPTPSSVA